MLISCLVDGIMVMMMLWVVEQQSGLDGYPVVVDLVVGVYAGRDDDGYFCG